MLGLEKRASKSGIIIAGSSGVSSDCSLFSNSESTNQSIDKNGNPYVGAPSMGAVGAITYRGRSASPPAHPVFTNAKAGYIDGDTHPPTAVTAILLAVPDSRIESVARSLPSLGGFPVVLHKSGVLGSAVLAPRASRGWATGSIHPLVSIPDPVTSAAKLRGASFLYHMQDIHPEIAFASGESKGKGLVFRLLRWLDRLLRRRAVGHASV